MTTHYLAYVDDGDAVEIIVHANGTLEVDGEIVAVDIQHISDETIYSLLIENTSHEIFAEYRQHGDWIVLVDGERHEVLVEDERAQRLRTFGGGPARQAGEVTITAPMPGLVVKFEVEEGSVVQAHQPLAILEAMKMENELRTPVNGVVKSIRVSAGTTVDQNEVLIVLGPPEES